MGRSRLVDRAFLAATLVFGATAFVALVVLTLVARDPGFTSASLVYGASLVACTLFSFLYNTNEATRWRPWLRYLDHASIFLLIAGTYTPFGATGMDGPIHGSLLTWVWCLAIAGMALKLFLPKSFDRLFVGVYVALGWVFVTAADDALRCIPVAPLILLGLGGLAYTVGACIFARDIGRWTDPVWHGCVLAGIVMHFTAVITFALSPGIA
ncbi:MAG TPA: hemolysin III family protein [Stellaceae bacterium]|nr:hemolysin III family protein [Stellaceae bacterium]